MKIKVSSKIENIAFILNILISILKENKPLKKSFVFSSILIVVTIVLNVFAPLAFRSLISHLRFMEHAELYRALILVAIYGGLWSLKQCTVQLREIFCFPLIEKILTTFIQNFFQKLQLLPINEYSKIHPGKIIDDLCRTQENFSCLFMGLFLHTIPTIIEMSIILLILIFYFNIIFSFIFVLFILLYLLFTIWGINKSSLTQKKYIYKRHSFQSFLTDRLLNFEIIKNFSQEDAEEENCRNHLRAYEKYKINSDIFVESLRLGQGLILGLLITALTFIGTIFIKKNELSVETLILINFYFIQIVSPLSFLGLALKDIKKGLLNIDEVVKFLKKEIEPLSVPSKKGHVKVSSKSSLELKNIGFSSDHQEILKNISFSLNQHKITALVGETGSGKSTIAKLLVRFFDPTAGDIYLDGQNINQIPFSILRKIVGYVSQSSSFFNDTLYNNLTYGNPHVSFRDVEEALEKTGLNDLVKSLPNGYQTQIGKNGFPLSGGQLQRISLARTFLIKPKFYILDEVTSALDVRNQEIISKTILSLSKNSSVLIISHRLSLVQNADEIIVLTGGEVTEKGTHSSLIHAQGLYSQFWKQSKGE